MQAPGDDASDERLWDAERLGDCPFWPCGIEEDELPGNIEPKKVKY